MGTAAAAPSAGKGQQRCEPSRVLFQQLDPQQFKTAPGQGARGDGSFLCHAVVGSSRVWRGSAARRTVIVYRKRCRRRDQKRG